jgi:hypothetical protein
MNKCDKTSIIPIGQGDDGDRLIIKLFYSTLFYKALCDFEVLGQYKSLILNELQFLFTGCPCCFCNI